MTQHNGKSRFQGKVAIITGAGSGIGKATAVKLAKEGAHVALFDLVNDRISETEAEINALHPGAARAFDVDISDPARVEKAVLETVELFGGLDIVLPMRALTVYRHRLRKFRLKIGNRLLQPT